MILGIGCDIIEITRIKKALQKENFLRKCFTDNELEYISLRGGHARHAAAAFAAKEAVSKALGTGVRGFSMRDIEILHDSLGKPYVNVFCGAKRVLDDLGGGKINISISHCVEYAAAFAVIEK